MANRISAALFGGLISVVGSATSFAESVTVTLPPGAEVAIRHVGGKDGPLVRVESNGVIVEANCLVLRSEGGRAWDGSPEMVAVESGIQITSGEKTVTFTSMQLFGGHTHSNTKPQDELTNQLQFRLAQDKNRKCDSSREDHRPLGPDGRPIGPLRNSQRTEDGEDHRALGPDGRPIGPLRDSQRTEDGPNPTITSPRAN